MNFWANIKFFLSQTWKTTTGKVLLVLLGALLTLSPPLLYFGVLGTPDSPRCLKAENFERTDTLWKKIRTYGFALAGHKPSCEMFDEELFHYLKGDLKNLDDPSKPDDSQELSGKIKSLVDSPDYFDRYMTVEMTNLAKAKVNFPADSELRRKIREVWGPPVNLNSHTAKWEESGFNWAGWLGTLLPLLIFGGLFLAPVIMQRLMSKGRHKIIIPGHGPKFDDVAGAEEAKEAFKEYVEFLRDPAKFSRLGARSRQGILISGGPGVGKTLLAAALAEEAGIPFISISGADFVEMYVGMGAKRVLEMYKAALKFASCIIFIDEIDAIGGERSSSSKGGGGGDEREGTLNKLLQCMDPVDKKGERDEEARKKGQGILWIAATNRPQILDPALKRPGRFDREINVPNPSLKARAAILAIYAKKIKLAASVDLLEVARRCPGYSGASLKNLVNEAAIIATRRDADAVYMVDFSQAMETIEMGAENRSLTMTAEERALTGAHEGGHVLANIEGEKAGHHPFQKVTIVPRGRALGLTWFRAERDEVSQNKMQFLAFLVTLMAGRVGEEIAFGDEELVTSGPTGDIQMVVNAARQAVCDNGWAHNKLLGTRKWHYNHANPLGGPLSDYHRQLIEEDITYYQQNAHTKARELLTAKKQVLFALTIKLFWKETMERQEVLDLIAEVETAKAAPGFKELTWDDVLEQTAREEERRKAAEAKEAA